MCDRCADLEEQVAFLKSELGLITDQTQLAYLRERYGVTEQGARILEVLGRAHGRVVNSFQLADMISPDADASLMKVQVCWLRKAIGQDAVLTAWGQGFRIGPAGLAALEAARRDDPFESARSIRMRAGKARAA